MTLDMAINHKKEHRKKYRGAKAVDKTCRNHGSDDWSKENRLHKNKKRQSIIEDKIKEMYEDYEYYDDYKG